MSYNNSASFTDNLITQFESLRREIETLSKKLNESEAEVERLSLDVKILSEELEYERRPKMDQR